MAGQAIAARTDPVAFSTVRESVDLEPPSSKPPSKPPINQNVEEFLAPYPCFFLCPHHIPYETTIFELPIDRSLRARHPNPSNACPQLTHPSCPSSRKRPSCPAPPAPPAAPAYQLHCPHTPSRPRKHSRALPNSRPKSGCSTARPPQPPTSLPTTRMKCASCAPSTRAKNSSSNSRHSAGLAAGETAPAATATDPVRRPRMA